MLCVKSLMSAKPVITYLNETLVNPVKMRFFRWLCKRFWTSLLTTIIMAFRECNWRLSKRSLKAGIRRLTRITRERGWLHKPRRRPKGLTYETTEIQELENIIKQDFSAEKPYMKMLTDINQIQCHDGKLYISPIMDCFNGEILSLEMRENMKKELCIDTFKSLKKRYPISGSVFHSDRGSQYTSDDFKKVVGVIQSLSGVAHCFDNARRTSACGL